MTLSEFNTILESAGYAVAYEHFPETDVPAMPFICYAETGSDNFAADGVVFEPVKMLQVQLFTKTKDIEAEGNLEAVLNESRIYWNKTAEYDEDELCYRTIYEVEI